MKNKISNNFERLIRFDTIRLLKLLEIVQNSLIAFFISLILGKGLK